MHDSSGKRTGAFRTLARRERSDGLRPWARSGGRGTLIAVLVALAASALGALAVHAATGSAPFWVSVSPSQRSVHAGSTVQYQITLHPQHFPAPITLSARGAPPHAKLQLTGSGVRQTLLVTTAPGTPTGSYQLLAQARGGTFRASTPLLLIVLAPTRVRFGISGDVKGLQPGVSRPLDLVLGNKRAVGISVTRLTVAIKSVAAPRSTPQLPCTLADFSIRGFSGAYPLVLPAQSSRRLSSFGVPTANLPQATMLNRRWNQDGCQGAKVSLAYAAQGVTR